MLSACIAPSCCWSAATASRRRLLLSSAMSLAGGSLRDLILASMALEDEPNVQNGHYEPLTIEPEPADEDDTDEPE